VRKLINEVPVSKRLNQLSVFEETLKYFRESVADVKEYMI
jgi:hypothetical protein